MRLKLGAGVRHLSLSRDTHGAGSDSSPFDGLDQRLRLFCFCCFFFNLFLLLGPPGLNWCFCLIFVYDGPT